MGQFAGWSWHGHRRRNLGSLLWLGSAKQCLADFFLPLTFILYPAIRFAAGEKRPYDSYCFVDPSMEVIW